MTEEQLRNMTDGELSTYLSRSGVPELQRAANLITQLIDVRELLWDDEWRDKLDTLPELIEVIAMHTSPRNADGHVAVTQQLNELRYIHHKNTLKFGDIQGVIGDSEECT